MKARSGMALALTIGIVSLIAILAVATLSLATRLVQDSSLGIHDVRLDGAAAAGLTRAIEEWRVRSIGKLAVGASVGFPVVTQGVPVTTTVSVTRIGPEVFWVVSEAAAGPGPIRRENLVLRRRMPDPQSLIAEDSTNVVSLGYLAVDSIVAAADVVAPGGTVLTAAGGIVHVTGSATMTGGNAGGILVVDGTLTIVGPLEFAGIIVAGGISVTSSGVSLRGLVRAEVYPVVPGLLEVIPSADAIQDVLAQSLIPTAVAGRRWAEIY